MYANIEDALYDPGSVVTIAITDLDTELPELTCKGVRGNTLEVGETTLVSFSDTSYWT